MKSKWLVLVGVALCAAQAGAQDTAALKTDKEKSSYGVGVAMARNLKRQGMDLDVATLQKGFADELSGSKLLISEDELRAVMTSLQTQMKQKQEQAMKTMLEENKKKGDLYLAENRVKDGVVALPSGLQYKILKAGDGKKPTADDTVECQYRGTLIDGTEFDSSYRGGKPVSFKVSQVIAGWQEALKLMPVGSKWQLVIPPALAYGERGAGNIGPNSTLVFEVELVSIKDKS